MRSFLHSLGRVALLLLAAFWFQTAVYETVCHDQDAMGKNTSAQSATCPCVCSCHPAANTMPKTEFFASTPPRQLKTDYVQLTGTCLPDDIFRPPLTNS